MCVVWRLLSQVGRTSSFKDARSDGGSLGVDTGSQTKGGSIVLFLSLTPQELPLGQSSLCSASVWSEAVHQSLEPGKLCPLLMALCAVGGAPKPALTAPAWVPPTTYTHFLDPEG